MSMEDAIAALTEAPLFNIGHRAWHKVGEAQLIFPAMQAAGERPFQIGDRLDEVMGANDARGYLVAVMRSA